MIGGGGEVGGGSQIRLLVGKKMPKKKRRKKTGKRFLGACNFCSSFVFVVFDGNTEIICGNLGVGNFSLWSIPPFRQQSQSPEKLVAVGLD